MRKILKNQFMKKHIITLIIGIISINVFAQIPSYVPNNGLVGWWPFNGNANDESGNGNNGTINGATLTIDRNGFNDKSYYFDGINDYIEVASNSQISVSNSYSISVWVNVSNYNSGGFPYQPAIVSKIDGGDWYGGYEIRALGDLNNTVKSLGTSGNIGGNNIALSKDLQIENVWTNITVSYDGIKLRFYLNGVCQDSINRTGSLQTSNLPLHFGKRGGSFQCWFNGKIDDVGIWNRALSQDEITEIYTGIPTCTNPIATITPQGNTTICQGSSVSLNASTGIGYIYEWYKDGNVINGSTGSSYSASQSGSYTVKVINGSCNATSNATIVTVNPNPLALISPQSSTAFCQGGSVILNASTEVGNTYEWYKNGIIMNGFISSSYTANQSGSYSVKVMNGACNTMSSVTLITVNPNPSAIITPQSNTTFCQGGSVILNASSGSGNSYEWYQDGNIINGSIASSYSANQNGSYTVKITKGSCSTLSLATNVMVNPNPSALITPQGSTTFCQGGSVILNGSSGIGYNYEWYKDGNIINGAITNFYTANQSGSYTVKVIDGSCYKVSSVTSVTVNPNPIVSLSLANLIHLKAATVTLSGSPSGGTYTGPGVVGNIFNSTNAGLGKKVIFYNYTSLAGCSGSATAITTVYDTTACSTFDTLFINVAVVGLTAPNNLGTLKIWPNPANDHIIIDNGNIAILSGYKVKIESILGQEAFKSSINQQQFSVDLSTWSGKGVYLVHIIDNQDNIIVTKKIVLQ